MDKYDAQIERLVHYSGKQVHREWITCTPLFEFCEDGDLANGINVCGCLTMIRGAGRQVMASGQFVPAITAAIASDIRIPLSADGSYCKALAEDWDDFSEPQRRYLLSVFAEWQRTLDATIRAGKPWHDDFTPRRTSREAVAESARV